MNSSNETTRGEPAREGRPRGTRGKWLIVAVEAALVLAILGLLVATWLPALIGAREVR